MMAGRIPLLCLLGGLAAAGCAPPVILIGEPGHLRAEKELPPIEAARNEPTFCIAAAAGPTGVGMALNLENDARFRDLRLLTREHSDPAACDVLFKLTSHGISVFSQDEVEAYSAFTQELLWKGSATGRLSVPGVVILGPLLQREFQPGTPAFERLQETKGRGRRLTPGGLEDFASRWLLSEADIPSALMKASRMRLGGARAEASAPAEAAAAVAQRSAPPAAAAESRSDVDEYPPPAAAQPRRHAVVIGVERYREQLPKADYAEADARAFAEYAKRVLGVPEENVALLTGERATRGDFEKYFERWLPNHVDKGGQVYVYYSGHGAPDAANGNAYLVPYDGDPTYIEQTGYSLKRLYDQLAKLPAARVVVVLDSCFSGGGSRSVIARGARPLVTVTLQAVPSNLTVISASGGNQVSNSYEAKGHGLFTYFLLKGLKEKGDDLRAVFDYLKPEVSRAARREHNADQEPQWSEGR